MSTPREVGSVSHLPQHATGATAMTWWGMAMMILIEAITLGVVAAAYLYLRQRFYDWPPEPVPLPDLLLPTVGLTLLLASAMPAWLAKRAAKRHDRAGVLRWLVLQSGLGVSWLVVRVFEFRSLNVSWDANAYGSVAWAVLVSHTVVAFLDVMDTLGLTLLFAFTEPEEKHLVDTMENSIFWLFIVIAWVVLFVLVILSPRWG